MCIACSKRGLRPRVGWIQREEKRNRYLLRQRASRSRSSGGNVSNKEIKLGPLVTCK